VDLEFVQDPQFSSGPISFDTLEWIRTCYPSHYDLPDCRLYPPSKLLRAGNLVAHILQTYTGDCGDIS
jgi:hypothetical protein